MYSMTSLSLADLLPPRTKRQVFVSYHHDRDQWYYNEFSRIFSEHYEVITDRSLARQIDSTNVDYVMRQIRETWISGSSCTIVLCGLETPTRKFVDWEIKASLDKQHGLLGVKLPDNPILANGGCNKPARLQDNIDTKYAEWVWWETLIASPHNLAPWIEKCVGRSQLLINNSRSMKTYNG